MKGPVDELVGHDEIRWLVLFLQRAHRGDRQNPLHAQLLHREDVGAEVQLRGQQQVTAAMAGKKGHLAPCQIAQNKGVGRIAEWGCDALFADVG